MIRLRWVSHFYCRVIYGAIKFPYCSTGETGNFGANDLYKQVESMGAWLSYSYPRPQELADAYCDLRNGVTQNDILYARDLGVIITG